MSLQTHKIGIEVYQVKIGVAASDNVIEMVEEMLNETFPQGFKAIDFEKCEHFFEIEDISPDEFGLSKNGLYYDSRANPRDIIALTRTEIRYTFSEFAVGKVILHAGAVAINNVGIIFPGKSMSGKSSIVAELLRRGARYYSDDYAILDADARLHPHAKKISLRDSAENPLRQIDYAVEHFQATEGIEPIAVKLVILTEYEAGKNWQPEKLSGGKAIMEIIPHTVPIRRKPAFTLRTLAKLVDFADVYSGKRGEMAKFAAEVEKMAAELE